MSIKRMTEKELLRDLDAQKAHADELADPLPQELTPLERLQGSVLRYDRPTDPVWDEYFDSDEGVSDDFMEDRNQPGPHETVREYIINLADKFGISYQPTPEDTIAKIATHLAGDEVVTDEIEDLIVAMRRAGVINGK